MKRLLERQIQKHLWFLTPDELKKFEPFFHAVDEAYEYSENDRHLMEHSLDISSQELLGINESLRKSAAEKQKILDALIETINKLEKAKNHDIHFEQIDAENISMYLKKLIDENLLNQEKLEILNRAINTSNVTVIVWEKDLETGKKSVKFVSKSIEKNFGYSYQDFIEEKIHLEDIVIPEDKTIFQSIHDVDVKNNSVHGEYRVKNASGEILWLSEEDVIQIKDKWKNHEYEGIIVDITSLKQKQQEIEDNEKYLSTIISNIWEGICLIDTTYKIKLINETGMELFWLHSDSVLSKDFFETIRFYCTSDETSYKETFQKYFLENKIQTIFEDICIKKDSKLIPVSVIISPIKWLNKDQTQGWIVVYRDKTKEQELDDMKSEFLSIASHELRTPMTVINGFSSLLLDDKIGTINDQQRKYLTRIKNNTQQLITLVNDMLALSKLESKNMHYEYTSFNLWELILDILGAFSLNAEEKHITLTGNTNMYMISSDRGKLDQVLINLVGNAIKFTDAGGMISIRIT